MKLSVMKLRWRIASCLAFLIATGALIWLLLPDYFVLLHSAAGKCKPGRTCTGSVHGPVAVCDHQRTLESCRIVVSECFGRGRLGNSMFILASMLAVAWRHDLLQAVPVNQWAEAQLVQLKSLFNITTSLPVHSGSFLSYRTVRESGWSVYNPAVMHSGTFGPLTKLGCYMQSWRYFSGLEDAVRLVFVLTDWYKYYVERYFREVKADLLYPANHTTVATHVFVAVHIRRGDMVSQKNYNVADDRFISRACYYFRNKYLNATSTVVFVVASDDSSWARSVMEPQQRDGAFVVYATGEAEEDMAVLASCHHAIITSGTFGWWAAWLTGGEVVYFRDYILPKSALWSGYKADDYYPPHWLGIP